MYLQNDRAVEQRRLGLVPVQHLPLLRQIPTCNFASAAAACSAVMSVVCRFGSAVSASGAWLAGSCKAKANRQLHH